MVARFHFDHVVYQEFLANKLSPGEEGDVAAHVERCADCQSKLEAMAAADIGWDVIRRFLQPDQRSSCRDAGSTTVLASGESSRTDHVEFLRPSDHPDSLGRFGRYEIKEILGRGGMGVVMRGYDPALNRHSAIKVLAPELATSASARRRFSGEAKAAAAVVHEHVVPILTVDEEHGLPYLVMPVVEGKSLEQRVATTGPLAVEEVLRIGRQIALGLAAAHAQGLVHRDVKPANILLENGVERVLITDFGLARAADDANLTQSGVVAGTPQYMSPEQARGGQVDQRSDLFSLGSVLYFVCAGHSPFRAETTMGVLNRITNEAPRSLRTISANIPVWLQDIIERLLEKDPAQRFQTAGEVADLLGKWLAHVQQPDVAPRPAAGGRWRTASRMKRTWLRARKVALALLGIAMLCAAAVVVMLEWNKGVIRIECPRPGVTVRIVKGDELCDELTVTPRSNSVRLAAGQYVVEIEGEHDGLKLENGVVTVTRGNTELVRIVQEDVTPDGTAASAESPTGSPLSPTVAAADSPSADYKRALDQLQGTWNATHKVDPGDVNRSRGTSVDNLTVNLTEVTVDLVNFDQSTRWRPRGYLAVSTKHTPWQIQLQFMLAGQPPTSLFGEYQIEGDHLKITWTAANNPRDFVGPVPAVWEFVRSRTADGSTDSSLNDGGALQDVIREFNEQCDKLEPRHGQPPLTVDELVASLRWAMMSRREDFAPEQIAGFELLLNSHRMPRGWKINHSTRIGPEGSDAFQCWSIVLQSPQGAHTIRQRLLRQPDKYDHTAAAVAAADSDPNATPLSAAIREFNTFHNDSVGKNQPPLTEEEVVAAVRWWKHRRDETGVTNAEFDAFQRIADARSLPEGFEFELLPIFEPGDGYEYFIWSARIRMQRTAKPGWTTAFDVREQFINCRLIDDGTTAWGPVADDGMQAGVQFIPAAKQYAKNQPIEVRFFLRNTSDEVRTVSLPNVMTHAYYKDIRVTDADGKDIVLRKSSGLGGPVGWMQVRIQPNAARHVKGMPIVIADEILDDEVETAIAAKPGQTCCVSFTLPNFADPDGPPLKTGELRFLATDAAGTGEAKTEPEVGDRKDKLLK